MQNLTRNLAILLTMTILVPVASAQSVDVALTGSADASGALDAVEEAKGTAGKLVDRAKADVDAIKGEIEAEAYATTEQASGFGAQAMALFEGALAGLQGFAASIAASLDISFG